MEKQGGSHHTILWRTPCGRIDEPYSRPLCTWGIAGSRILIETSSRSETLCLVLCDLPGCQNQALPYIGVHDTVLVHYLRSTIDEAYVR